MNIFSTTYQSKKTGARTGSLKLSHGTVQTPAFVPVGTQGTVKGLLPEQLKSIKVQLFFCNTYHLYLRPGADIIEKQGGLHKFIGWQGPLITDSGGFQIFSLTRGKKTKSGKPLCQIDDEGVTFTSHLDGSKHRFTAEKSIAVQHQLGADIIIAFDDCTPYPATPKEARASLERTKVWAKQSVKAHQQDKSPKNQALYGVVQGSVYQDLREESAAFTAELDVDGIAIGGVSVGESKDQMRQVLNWAPPKLDPLKPRHLLGVGEIDDIFYAVFKGVDTLDCVVPTRWARNGTLLVHPKTAKTENAVHPYRISIQNERYTNDAGPIDKHCTCYVCQQFSKSFIRHLFMTNEMLGPMLASWHNVAFMTDLFAQIREAITREQLPELAQIYGVTL